jgi:hypothetical protein
MATKLQTLMEAEGFDDSLEFLEVCSFDSVVPGICTNEGCDYTRGVEPDSYTGWCEECKTNTVKSALALMGAI